jgi:hypothetical protein
MQDTSGDHVSIFDFLKRRSAPPDAEAVELLAGLATQQLFVLSLNPGGEFKGDPNNTEEFIAWVEQNARETAASSPLRIYCYEEGGQSIMPFFSSSKSVSAFIGSDPAHKYKAFTNAGMKGATLFKYLFQAASVGSRVVLDPRSDQERPISVDALRAVVG